MQDCIFCKIVKKDLPSEFEMETDSLVVFKDIHPKAPIHLLIVPKKHIENILSVENDVWLEIKNVVQELSKKLNVSGFRIVNNGLAAAEVKHMHVHFLGEVGLEREL